MTTSCPTRRSSDLEVGVVDQIDAHALRGIDEPDLLGELAQPLGRFELLLKRFRGARRALDLAAAFLWSAGGVARDGECLGAGLPGAMRIVVDIGQRGTAQQEIGRASCRERVCQYV